MNPNKIEVRLTEKETANYFSNAAALYVLGIGFAVFAYKAQSPFMVGACFWFSVFLLCDSFRLARVCNRFDHSDNLLLCADGEGLTHYGSWLHPEHRSWKEITGFRHVKTPVSDTVFFQSQSRPGGMLRYALFGAPKLDLPLTCVPGGWDGFLSSLAGIPQASHLLPPQVGAPVVERKAA